ncbi:MAG: YicC/YloC family endoribonuclease [Lachnospiraceae bacterium]
MIKSMTGFGRCEVVTTEYKISVEMKAVNHRYLDLNIKMPRKFNFMENNIRNLLKAYIQRGKVDIFISYENYTQETLCLKYNSALAAEYVDYFQKMEQQFDITNDMKVSGLARMPEVLMMTQAQEDEDQMWQQISQVVEAAAVQFVDTRITEGERLKKDLMEKLDYIQELVAFVEERYPAVIAEYRTRLYDKVNELISSTTIDEGRLATEVTIFADKICVDEETVRLKSHIDGTRKALSANESVGRKLDFIAQEMNREANTILSKSGDLELTEKAILLKTEIEKVREQIQNIE